MCFTGVEFVIAAVGIAVSAASSVASSVQQGKMADAQARVQKRQATQAQEVAKIEADQHRMKLRRILGVQKVNFAAQNSRLGSGSPLQILEDTATLGAFDEEMILYNGELTAWGYNQQAALTRFAGQTAVAGGITSAIGQGITAGTSLYLAGANTQPTTAPISTSPVVTGVGGGGGGGSSFSGLVVQPGTFNPKTAGPRKP